MSLEVRFSRPAPVPVPDKTKPQPRDKIQPRLLGWLLFILSHILDRLGFLQKWVWHQAGFDALRGIAEQIGPVDPRLDPTVLPRHDCISLETTASRSEDVPETETSSPQANSVVGYRAAFLSGRLTPLELVNSILPLIRRDITPAGKHSTAWIEVKSNLIIASAEESTLRYKQKRSLGPLDGIPVAVKECFDVIGYKKNLGTRFDLTSKDANGNEFDSWCILKLKEAGAIIMGKVSMHELGLDTSGTNVTFGTPRNPYNPMYYTGGSSSGSAYAVASGLVPLALGTDGGGSVRIPSSFCSVFGLKPTHGRLSYLPGQSLANTCEVIGPIAADMQSLATFFEVIGQGHPDSCFPSTIPRLLSDVPGRRKVLGIPEEWFQRATPTIQKMCHRIVESLVSRKGYTTVPIQIPFTAEGQIAHALTMLTDASVELNGNTAFISAPNRIFASLGRATPGSDYVLAQKLRHVLMRHLAYLWEAHPGMLIITPTTACPGWPIRSEAELQFGISDGKQTMKTMEYVWLANFCGVPSLSVPAGFVVPDGHVGEGGEAVGEDIMGKVPVGLMATAEWTCEHALVQFGLDVEGIHPRLQEHPPEWVDGLALNST